MEEVIQIKKCDIDILANDLKRLEKELMPQLDELANKLPEIYSGYANMVREITTAVMELCSFSKVTSNKIAFVAEVSARALESFGSYKAAKKHNQMLHKFLAIKQSIAKLNTSKVKRLLPESNRNLDSLTRLFELHMNKKCNFTDISIENIDRVVNIQLCVLNMYRTSLFLNMLVKYLEKEYKAWNRGEQTSGESMPDYFSANSLIVENLCGNRDNAFQIIETAADATVSLTGKEMVLLCDQQLFTYAIGDEICLISLDKAHPYIGKIISSHNGVETHLQTSKVLREHIEDKPNGFVWTLCIVSWIVIICMSIWYLPGTVLARTMIAIAGCVAILKVGLTSSKKIDRVYFSYGDVLIEDYIQNVSRQCGKIDEVEIDYDEKDAFTSALNTFIR